MKDKKVAIITAAGKGLGKAIALEFHKNGYELALMSVSSNAIDLAKELGCLGLIGSVTNEKDLQTLVHATLDKYHRIDAVVNNTGHPAKGALLDIPDESWHDGLDLLLMNVIKMSRLVVPVMEKQGGGAIVNVSTFAAFEPSLAFPVSSALRAALGSFAKMFADQYGGIKIRMNNVLPGYMDNYPVDGSVIEKIPLKRTALVEEVARAVYYLSSGNSSYITGQNLRVDGGITRSV